MNDDLETMKNLVHKLLMCRVRPYYIYQCDLINGSAHLRTSVAKGIEIIEGLRGHTTGYAVPQFVIDAPGGGGKVPINPGYILYHDNEKDRDPQLRRKHLRVSGSGRRSIRAIRARARISRRVSLLVTRLRSYAEPKSLVQSRDSRPLKHVITLRCDRAITVITQRVCRISTLIWDVF